MKNKKELIRVVRTPGRRGGQQANPMDSTLPETSPEAEFCLDFTGKKSGRGAYVCNDLACFEKAAKQKGLERSFKQAVPLEVYEQLRKEFDNGS